MNNIENENRSTWDFQTVRVQVVVVGAGPAGSTTAVTLAQQGFEVMLVDSATFPREKVCGDGLTPRSILALKEIGVLSKVEQEGAMRITAARIFAPNGQSIQVGFDELDGQLPPYGLTLTRKRLDAILVEHAKACGVQVVEGVRVSELLLDNGSVAGVKGRSGEKEISIGASLTCLATGVTMPLLQKTGILTQIPPVIRASRAYFTGVNDQDPVFQLYFDKHLIPGYGWIFPMRDHQANVGAGYFPTGRFRRRIVPSRQLYQRFIDQNVSVREQLLGAEPVGAVKSFPLRTDYPRARTEQAGLLVVGEAAGLVNPINGEGVDFALESGLVAATVAGKALLDGDLSQKRLAEYGHCLNTRYGSFFLNLGRMRNLYIRERVLNRIFRKAKSRPQLKTLFVNAALGLIDPREGLSWRTLRQIVF